MDTGTPYAASLAWIDGQHETMRRRVVEWCSLNTGTDNLRGLATMLRMVRGAFDPLGAHAEELTLPPASDIDSRGNVAAKPLGRALKLTKRTDAPVRALLAIHIDTVYPADHPFQSVSELDPSTLRGPGVVDAKGGLAVMLTALEAVERSSFAGDLGREVLINPDEEIGSVGSAALLADAAARNHVGLVFEPALPDGAMVDQRRGVGNFVIVVRGRAAHAGRDFASGRNAVVAAAKLAVEIHELNATLPGVTVNVGRLEGGGSVNVVPDVAVLRVNARTSAPEDESRILDALESIVAVAGAEGITATLHGCFTSPPKLINPSMRQLMTHVDACGRELGMKIRWRASGGACDGNKLAAAGLPTVDTLGPRGGDLHSPTEYLLLDSLTERAKLTALLLMKLASREFPLPGRGGANVSEPT